MNNNEIAKILKKHARYGNGVFAIIINEYDKDYETLVKWMEQDSPKAEVPIIETVPASTITQEEWENFWYDK